MAMPGPIEFEELRKSFNRLFDFKFLSLDWNVVTLRN